MRRSVSASEAHLARGYGDGRARLALLELRHALRECSGLPGEGAVTREQRGLHLLERGQERADFGLCGGRVRWVRVRGGTLVRAVRERRCVAREDRQRAIYLGEPAATRRTPRGLARARSSSYRRAPRCSTTSPRGSNGRGRECCRRGSIPSVRRVKTGAARMNLTRIKSIQQYESRNKPEKHEDRDGGDCCDERDAQRDESDGEGDEENREHHDRDGNEAEGDETERAREKMADDSKRAGRRRFSRRRLESDWTRHQLLLAYSYSNNRW